MGSSNDEAGSSGRSTPRRPSSGNARDVAIRRVVSLLRETVAEGPERLLYRHPARNAHQAHRVLKQVLSDQPVEEFWSLLLDGRHRILGLAQVSVGTLTTSLVHPREVFGPAIRLGAAAVIVAHNHPSGDPAPSVEDIDVTRRLIDAGRLLGIPLLDHVVCGEDAYVSLRDHVEF